ncbi:hypothetical protein HUK80_09300 [Flavobacterium sp. MAH-1]|uniref:DUF4252 domain-containing protein n=1 Tax=Flavobacterium agri TaxID=2743471 RepID=A0A7Y8Y370_9FLAO|nr:hypothetical protein [Flavobacterium agri]NUY81089.1 hypothetical protein [Flavobacterium agri]NYA71113.1 hypothetical protein [Flavobacterium agri]
MKLKFILPILLIALSGIAQTAETLNTRAQELFAATNKQDMAKVMDFTYNKVFEGTGIDRAQLAEAMKQAFDNEIMSIQITNPLPVQYKADPIKTIEGKKFSVIRYRNSMKVNLKQQFEKPMVDGMIDGMKKASNYESVVYDEKTNSISIAGDAVMIAVADESTKNQWQFVNYDNKEMFNLVFNENIKKELGL